MPWQEEWLLLENWKMNMTPNSAVALIKELIPLVQNDDVDVALCVPDLDILPCIEAVQGTNIGIGSQNMYFEEKGAFTGEIAPDMLTDVGVEYVILGHSERRSFFAETDETVNKKVLKAFEHDIIPIICCGETLKQRKQGITLDLIRMQIKIAFYNVKPENAKKAICSIRTDLGNRHGCRCENRPGTGSMQSNQRLSGRDL